MPKFFKRKNEDLKIQDYGIVPDESAISDEKIEVSEEKKEETEIKTVKKTKKKWAELTGVEKTGRVFDISGMLMGKTVRFFAKTFLVLFVLVMIAGCSFTVYLGSRVLPLLEDYKVKAYEKFDVIDSNTFMHLGDTVIYDKDGNIISEINVSNYEYVEVENLSPWVYKGYIAVEDKAYKYHNGLNYKGLMRAAVSLVQNRGEITQGGSSITQQVIKNNLLSQERTFQRKFLELFLAPEFEKRYTKHEIMEFYVNTNFYGNNCYGIETASLYYFGKPSIELTIPEAAMFVGMSNNATVYNPKTNYDLVKEKQEVVLGEMLEDGYITKAEYDEAVNAPLNLVYNREAREKEDYQTSYAIHCATLNLMEQDGFTFKYQFKDKTEYSEYREKYVALYESTAEKIRNGGYTIYTSLNTNMQNELQKLIDDTLKGYKEKAADGRYAFQGAAVIVNNETGYVEAIVGGRGTDDEFNRGFLAKRQPGSSIKPLVAYGPAFNSGLYYPSMIMTDKDDPNDEYFPKNYGGSVYGNITLREALGRSLNTIPYMILKEIGPNNGMEYLAKMRFDTMTHEDNYNTAVALGGFTYGVRVTDMAKGFSTLVNQGNYIDNNCIYKIEFQNEGVIFEEDSSLIPVFEADAAYMVTSCCQGVMDEYYGTGRGSKLNNQVAMGKTGTTNDNKDAWFCGATEYYSMAVWVGYDTPRSTGLTGGTVPGQIWKAMMNKIHVDLEKVEFVRPETVVDLDIDYNGNISPFKTGEYGMFSRTLLDKAEKEKIELEKQKKIDKDNALIADIQVQLVNLKNYVIKDIDALNYLKTRFNRISSSIDKVIQEEQKESLVAEFESIKSYFAVDIRNMERYEIHLAEIEAQEKEIKLEQEVVSLLNDFNSYFVQRDSDIDAIESKYSEISYKISSMKKEEKRLYYQSKLDEIMVYKEILLKPYRQERAEILKAKQIEMSELLNHSILELRGLTNYYEGVEFEFDSFKLLLKSAKELDMNIDSYESELNTIYERIMAMKPVPPVLKDDSEGVYNSSGILITDFYDKTGMKLDSVYDENGVLRMELYYANGERIDGVFDNNGNLLSDVKISKPEVSENEVLDENSDVEDNNNLVDNSEDD